MEEAGEDQCGKWAHVVVGTRLGQNSELTETPVTSVLLDQVAQDHAQTLNPQSCSLSLSFAPNEMMDG